MYPKGSCPPFQIREYMELLGRRCVVIKNPVSLLLLTCISYFQSLMLTSGEQVGLYDF